MTGIDYDEQKNLQLLAGLITNKWKKEKVVFAIFSLETRTILTADIDALVGTVFTVRLSVTMPSLRHTLTVLADKVGGRTRLFHCRQTKKKKSLS